MDILSVLLLSINMKTSSYDLSVSMRHLNKVTVNAVCSSDGPRTAEEKSFIELELVLTLNYLLHNYVLFTC